MQPNNNSTHISIVLDASGSMHPIADDTIGGFNRFLAEQQQQPGADSATITIVLFNDERRVVCSRTPLSVVAPLTRQTYLTTGNTALLDAVGETLSDTSREIEALPETERPEKVLFVILTDGCENASREYTRRTVFDLIRERQEKHGWQFLFLGANQDAIAEGGKIGIAPNTCATFNHDEAGTLGAFATASNFVQTFGTLVNPKTKPSLPDPTAEARKKLSRERRKQPPSKN